MKAGNRLHHGGDIQSFCQQYSFSAEHCLDMSTGISPWAWPVPGIPEEIWQKLPSRSCHLLGAAEGYYQCNSSNILAVPGSQAAIQHIAKLLPAQDFKSVAIPELGYQEHSYCWAQAGHRIERYGDLDSLDKIVAATTTKYAVVINPNNPTTQITPPEALLSYAEILASRGGFLLVDEAFADATPNISLSKDAGTPGLLVLRSLGKFFGMAGLRLGFVLGQRELLDPIESAIGLWPVNGPAQWLGEKMLCDQEWIVEQRSRLTFESEQMRVWMQNLLPDYFWHKSCLFVSAEGDRSAIEKLAISLNSAAVMVRVFELTDDRCLIRLGLTDLNGKQRIAEALAGAEIVQQNRKYYEAC